MLTVTKIVEENEIAVTYFVVNEVGGIGSVSRDTLIDYINQGYVTNAVCFSRNGKPVVKINDNVERVQYNTVQSEDATIRYLGKAIQHSIIDLGRTISLTGAFSVDFRSPEYNQTNIEKKIDEYRNKHNGVFSYSEADYINFIRKVLLGTKFYIAFVTLAGIKKYFIADSAKKVMRAIFDDGDVKKFTLFPCKSATMTCFYENGMEETQDIAGRVWKC